MNCCAERASVDMDGHIEGLGFHTGDRRSCFDNNGVIASVRDAHRRAGAASGYRGHRAERGNESYREQQVAERFAANAAEAEQ